MEKSHYTFIPLLFFLIATTVNGCWPFDHCNCDVFLICRSCNGPTYYTPYQCNPCSSYCLTCSSLTSCTSCAPNYGVSMGVCALCISARPFCAICTTSIYICQTCYSKYGFNSSETDITLRQCYPCVDEKCLYCSPSIDQCFACDTGWGVVSANATCELCQDQLCLLCTWNVQICVICIDDGEHGINGQICSQCLSPCLNCSNTNYALCRTCIDRHFLLGDTCLQCSSDCAACTSFTDCTQCDSGFSLRGGICTTCPEFCIFCTFNTTLNLVQCDQCTQDGQFNFTLEPVAICEQLCGDSYTQNYPCDNQKGIQYDGCDDNCQVMDDFVCELDNITNGYTLCSYEGLMTADLISYKKQQWSNEVIFEIKILPILARFKIMTQSQLLEQFSFINDNLILNHIKFIPQTNTFIFKGIFSRDLIDQSTIKIKFIQPFVSDQQLSFNVSYGVQLPYFYSTLQFTLSHIIYIMSIFTCVIALTSLIVGIFARKLAGLEAILVLQIYWLTFFWNHSSFLFLPFQMTFPLKFTSGYNHFFFPDILTFNVQSPYEYQFQLSQFSFVNNFNFSFIIFLIPFLMMSFYRIRLQVYKFSGKIQIDECDIIDQRYEYFAKFVFLSNQILMKACILILLYFVNCAILFFTYAKNYDPINILVFAFGSIAIIGTFLNFFKNPTQFGCFHSSFHEKILATNHYFIHIAVNLCIILLLAFSRYYLVALIPSLFMMFFTGFYGPYLNSFDNYRSCFNYGVVSTFMMFMTITDYVQKTENVRFYMFMFVFFYSTVVLPIVVILGSSFTIYDYFYTRFLVPILQSFQLERTPKSFEQNRIYKQMTISGVNDKIGKQEDLKILRALLPTSLTLKSCSNALSQLQQCNSSKVQCLEEDRSFYERRAKIKKQVRQRFGRKELKQDNLQQETGQKICTHTNEIDEIEEIKHIKYVENTQEIAARVVKDENRYINLKGAADDVNNYLKMMEIQQNRQLQVNFIQIYDQISQNNP